MSIKGKNLVHNNLRGKGEVWEEAGKKEKSITLY